MTSLACDLEGPKSFDSYLVGPRLDLNFEPRAAPA
jgi:hypothetical protein